MKPVPASSIEAFRRDPKQYQAVKDLLDGVNGTRRALEVGDYADRPQYGAWDTVHLSACGMRAGTTAPATGTFQGLQLPQFQVTASLNGTIVLPGSFDPDGALWPVIRLGFPTAPNAGDVVSWALTVNAAGRDGVFRGSSTTYYPAYSVVAADLVLNRAIRLAQVPFALRPLDTVLVRIQRIGATSVVDPILFGIDFDFQRGPFGAETRP